MNNSQPTTRRNSTEAEKPFEKLSPNLRPVFKALSKCSEETRQEAADKILEELDEVQS